MDFLKFWKLPGRLMFVSESIGVGKSSRSSTVHDTLSDTVPRSKKSLDFGIVSKRQSTSLKAVSPGSKNSGSLNHVSSVGNETLEILVCPSSSDAATLLASTSNGITTAASSGYVGTSETVEEIVTHVDSTVSPSLKDELKEVFQNFDVNNDGKISASELKIVFEALGDDATDEEAVQILKDVDTRGVGYIDFDNFISISSPPLESNPEVFNNDELKAAFDIFDANKEGFITATNLSRILNRLTSYEYTVEQCEKMIERVDENGDGKVDFEDFKLMMS